jgi:hypothetical protein
MAIQFTITIEGTQVINGVEYTQAQLQQGLVQVRTAHNQRMGANLTDAEFLQWADSQNLAAWYEQGKGSESVPPSPIAPVARKIDARRLRLALLQLNLLNAVEDAIASQGVQAQVEWQYATHVSADHPLVLQLVAALSLDVDAIFNLAGTFT